MFNNFIKEHKKRIEEFDFETSDERKKAIAFIAFHMFSDSSENESDFLDEENIIDNNDITFVCKDDSDDETIAIVKITTKNDIINNWTKWIWNVKNIYNNNEIKEAIDNVTSEFEITDKTIVKYYLIAIDEKIIDKDSIKIKANEFLGASETFGIYDIEEVNWRIVQDTKKDLYVKKANLVIDKENNFLEYNSDYKIVDKAIVCNISAKSLKEIHRQHGTSIFNLNLRFFKKKKDVDDSIGASIKEGTKFWFLNNGIYIVCDDFEINNRELTIHNFSIINGGQTTHKISNVDFDNDFFLICKIIAINDWFKDEIQKDAYDFANEIAIASNKQKPIKNEDLISNLAEVKNVEMAFTKYNNPKFGPIFCETKKGEFDLLNESKKKYYKKSNVKSAEYFMQLRYAWSKLLPGSAKNGKTKIYNDKKNIEDSFREISENIDLYAQLSWIHGEIKKLPKMTKKELNKTHLKNICKYFDLFNLSLIRLLFIYERTGFDIDFYESIMNSKNIDEIIEAIKNEDVKYQFSLGDCYNDFIKNFKDFLTQTSHPVLSDCIKNKYGSDDIGQAHNLVKYDEPLLCYIQSTLLLVKRDSDLREIIKNMFR